MPRVFAYVKFSLSCSHLHSKFPADGPLITTKIAKADFAQQVM